MKLISSVRKKLVGTERPNENRANNNVPARNQTLAANNNLIAGERVPRDIAPRNVPTTQASRPNPQNMSSKFRQENPFANLPSLRETPAAERVEVYRKKLQACSIVYDFSNPSANVAEKDAKRLALLELVDYENTTRSSFSQDVIKDVVHMISSNIFRTLSYGGNSGGVGGGSGGGSGGGFQLDMEDDEIALESSWPHLQFIYEYFLRFVANTDVDPKFAKKYIDNDFIVKLIDLFHSQDPRERDYLKTILHRIYGRFMALRSFIRKSIQYMFFKFLYEEESYNGITELLEILGSIINGFALPLKDEHKVFLEKCLIPLHRSKSLLYFHQQLTYCMTQYIEKDSQTSIAIINGILQYWPKTNTPKEVILLNELEEILELIHSDDFEVVIKPLFNRFTLCITSPHFQVAERVLFLWNNENIVKFVNQYRRIIYPIIIGSLYKNSKHHWNTTVHGLTFNVLRILMESDPPLFDECFTHYKKQDENISVTEDDRDQKWSTLMQKYQ